ncbi:putative phosphodiesterase/alkaline phosphatase [Sphingobium sp. SYK-6]|uniref:alkaline phosphatase D family protein n=1 Tax=Sphingobium sp. (strain NBRC 103272 / SYK-6) TaxID=627192 RepID=UPI00022774B3|nr:alkaline phosphatase D family protein [Sphingobium sp. SYK-6]BAK67765.1 putative phosphodiesterase/alkaline phosphatase [Sphingobium sp. SYK-6]
MKVDRRRALGLFGSGAILPVAAARAQGPGNASFRHGVASGDPSRDGAVLWTRVTPGDPDHAGALPVRWFVAATPEGKPIEHGSAEARPARDFTVKVQPRRLKAGRDYVYWFELADGTRSPVGRFRTLPAGETADLVLAVASCQLFPGGFFNAWDSVARLERLDAVIHLGDYIYEYGAEGYGAAIGSKIGRSVEPPHEIVTLADYRMRHAQYKSDPALQAAHARAAFICVWDDHETANDAWLHGAENHQPEREGQWADRKAAAMQAYFEWMPIRDPAPGAPWDAINRSFTFGDLATLAMVETRLLARSEQAGFKGATPAAEDIAAVLAERNRPDRELLGEPQRAWLERELTASVAAGVPWQLIGNQVVMARVNGPDLAALLGAERAAGAIGGLDAATRAQVEAAQAGYRAGLPFNLDAWDGYPAARERLYDSFRRAGSQPLILSGDSHAFWANALADQQGEPVAVEFGTSGISSPSVGDAIPQLPLGDFLTRSSPEVAFCDQRAKGYTLLRLTREAAVADYVAMSTIFARDYEARLLARFEVAAAAQPRVLKRASANAEGG